MLRIILQCKMLFTLIISSLQLYIYKSHAYNEHKWSYLFKVYLKIHKICYKYKVYYNSNICIYTIDTILPQSCGCEDFSIEIKYTVVACPAGLVHGVSGP